MKKYRINATPYNDIANIATSNVGRVNSIQFINAGDTMAFINGVPVYPAGSWIPPEGNENEIDVTTYRIKFESIGGTTNNNLWVITKVYD